MDILAKTALADGTYVAYTDGSCKPNPGPGGCAFRLYAPDGSMIENDLHFLETNNNVAEMWAVIDALTATPDGASVLLFLDSGYIKDGLEKYLTGWLTRNWRKSDGKEVANRELWETIIALTETRKATFLKIKARSSDVDKKRVDVLAKEAADRAVQRILSAKWDAA
ncbi:ribonuclease HI [Rhodobacteraceae bacterium KMM 6894]|nr:ribonuclease HI [Rhodobacteraceae bacterium KMM 6894]